PDPKRCTAALALQERFGRAIPLGKCDDGLSISTLSGFGPSWTQLLSIAGLPVVRPHNDYMIVPCTLGSDPLKPIEQVVAQVHVFNTVAAFDLAPGKSWVLLDTSSPTEGVWADYQRAGTAHDNDTIGVFKSCSSSLDCGGSLGGCSPAGYCTGALVSYRTK